MVARGDKVANDKGKQRDESPMKKEQSKEPLGSKRSKNNGKGKVLCCYYGRGFHSKRSYMRRQLDEIALLLKKHNIYVPASARKDESKEEEDQEYQRKGHALKACCTSAHVFLIDSGASNHMAHLGNHSLIFQSFDGPSIQIGNNSKFKTKGKRSVKLEHGRFKDVLFVPSLASNLLSVY